MKNIEKNIIRELRRISDNKQIYFMDVLRTYVKYVEEGAVGEIPDVLEYNKEAYERTKQHYFMYNEHNTEVKRGKDLDRE